MQAAISINRAAGRNFLNKKRSNKVDLQKLPRRVEKAKRALGCKVTESKEKWAWPQRERGVDSEFGWIRTQKVADLNQLYTHQIHHLGGGTFCAKEQSG
jgi:hypothetical protein